MRYSSGCFKDCCDGVRLSWELEDPRGPNKEGERIPTTTVLAKGVRAAVLHMTAVMPVDPALWDAALRGATEEARQLLAGGANVEERGGSSLSTPLQVAVRNAQTEVVHLLLENRADVSAKDNGGWMALHWGALGGSEMVVKALLEHRANVLAETSNGWIPKDYAISRSHVKVVSMLKAEAVSRTKCVAFAMGHHERLGVGSRLEGLDPEVVRKVLEQV